MLTLSYQQVLCCSPWEIRVVAQLVNTRTPHSTPLLNLHGTLLVKTLMHIKSIPKQMWLMAPALLETLILRAVHILCQNRLVIRMCALFDDFSRALFWRHASHVCKTLLSHNDVEVMFSLVYLKQKNTRVSIVSDE